MTDTGMIANLDAMWPTAFLRKIAHRLQQQPMLHPVQSFKGLNEEWMGSSFSRQIGPQNNDAEPLQP